MSLALAGRHDRISAWRINLCRPPARDHSHVGVRTDYSNTVNLGRIERKLCVIVLQEHDAVLFDFLCHLEAAPNVHYALLRRIVDYTGGKHRAQDAMNMIIDLGRGYFARLDRLLQIVSKEDLSRFLMIEAGRRSLFSAMCSSPV